MPVSKLGQLVEAMRASVRDAGEDDWWEKMAVYRDVALLLVTFWGTQRSGQMASLHTSNALRLLRNQGILFNFYWAKTRRDGGENIFGVPLRPSQPEVCPLRALNTYVKLARSLGWDMGGYLFHAMTPVSKLPPGSLATRHKAAQGYPHVLQQPAMNDILRVRLEQFGLFKGDTMHGFRSGGGVQARLTGMEADDLSDQAGWKDPEMAEYYLRLMAVLQPGGIDTSLFSPGDYETLNNLGIDLTADSHNAFP